MKLDQIFNYRKSVLILTSVTISIYLFIGVVHSDFLQRDYYSDEAHFIPTIRLFIEQPTIETLRTYPELTTPLVYILYAIWGKIAGSENWQLRCFSLIIATLTFAMLYQILNQTLQNKSVIYFLVLLFMVNPYVFGLSVYVYTDMCTLLFLLLSFQMLKRKKFIFFTVSSACVLLCRQFGIFFVGGVLLYGLIGMIFKKENYYFNIFISSLLALFPFASLCILWKGIAPNSGMERFAYAWEFLYHNYFTVYVSSFWVYILPLVIIKFRTLFYSRWQILIFVAASFLYPLMPIKVSPATALEVNLATNGFLNKLIFTFIQVPFFRSVIYAFMFGVGVVILHSIVRSMVDQIKKRLITLDLCLELSILLFFVIMPAQYQVWEKYLLIVIPFLMLYFSKTIESNISLIPKKV